MFYHRYIICVHVYCKFDHNRLQFNQINQNDQIEVSFLENLLDLSVLANKGRYNGMFMKESQRGQKEEKK